MGKLPSIQKSKAYPYNRLYVPPHVEIPGNIEPSGFQEFFQLVEYRICRGLVGYGFIPEGVEVEFQGFKFHHLFPGRIYNPYGCEVRVARTRAEAREFRITYVYCVIPAGEGVVPGSKARPFNLFFSFFKKGIFKGWGVW